MFKIIYVLSLSFLLSACYSGSAYQGSGYSSSRPYSYGYSNSYSRYNYPLPAIMVIPATVIIPMVLAVIATESHVIITRLPGITDITTGMLSATLVITGGTRGIINNIQDIKMIMSTHDLGMWVDLAHCRLVPSL